MKICRKWIDIELPDDWKFETERADVIIFPHDFPNHKFRIVSFQNLDGRRMTKEDLLPYLKVDNFRKCSSIKDLKWQCEETTYLMKDGRLGVIWGLFFDAVMVLISSQFSMSDMEIKKYQEVIPSGISLAVKKGT